MVLADWENCLELFLQLRINYTVVPSAVATFVCPPDLRAVVWKLDLHRTLKVGANAQCYFNRNCAIYILP